MTLQLGFFIAGLICILIAGFLSDRKQENAHGAFGIVAILCILAAIFVAMARSK